MAVTAIVFTALVGCDVMLWQSRPCDLLDFTSPLTILGELLFFAGLLVRAWAAGTLTKCEQIVKQGPYQFVRNPLYLGSFLMMLGFSVLIRDWLAFWIVLGPLLAMYLNKVRQEERYLARIHPVEWPAYMQSTPRFFPEFNGWPSLAGFSFRQWAINREYQALIASVVGLFALWCWHAATG